MDIDRDELIRIGEAARLLQVAVETVRRYDKEGKLRALRTPAGQRRFRRSDVEALLIASEAREAEEEDVAS